VISYSQDEQSAWHWNIFGRQRFIHAPPPVKHVIDSLDEEYYLAIGFKSDGWTPWNDATIA